MTDDHTTVTHGINSLVLETNDDITNNLLERRYRQARLAVFNELKQRLSSSGYTIEEFAAWLQQQTLAPTTADVLRENRKHVHGTIKNAENDTTKPSDERQASKDIEDEYVTEEKTPIVKPIRHGTKAKNPRT